MSHPRILARLCLWIVLITGAVTLILSKGHPHQADISYLETQVPDGAFVRLVGHISGKIQSSDGHILVITVDELAYRRQFFRAQKLYLYEQEDTPLVIGDRLEIGGTIRYFEHARNPGNFDRHFYYAVRGIEGRVAPGSVQLKSRPRLLWQEKLYRWSVTAHERLIEHLGEEDGSLLSAMILGKRSLIDPDMRRLYQKNGIAHLLAISGPYVSILGVCAKSENPHFQRFRGS